MWSNSLRDYIWRGGTLNFTCCWREASYWDHQKKGSYALSILHYLFNTFSAIRLDPPSVSPTQAVFCKEYCPSLINICAQAATESELRVYSMNILSLVYYIKVTIFTYPPLPLPLKLGMTPALLRWALWLCWVFTLILRSIHSRKSMFHTETNYIQSTQLSFSFS